MLDDQVLSRITGTIIRGVERIATKDVLAFLGLDQRETKRSKTLAAALAPAFP
jgi:hypothetical protein